ncbi:MAG: lysophospholipid acyltransferase family protein [Pseudomonadota bacterium]
MPSEEQKPIDVEALRNPQGRTMTWPRRLAYAIGTPIALGLIRLLWMTYRVRTITGGGTVDQVIASQRAHVPCYWHRDILICLMTIKGWVERGFDAGIIISPSVDGEVPSTIAGSWGVKVVRGSATRTGTLAMREMHQVMKAGTSIITAADGPVGPAYFFKAGVVLTSRIGKAPMLPIACAADRAWYLKRWDDFMIPKPFARIAIAVGDPHSVPPGTSAEGLEEQRQIMQDAVNSLFERSKAALDTTGSR